MVAFASRSKPLSRAHGNSALDSCRDRSSNSLNRIEIQLSIYESCDRLESLSRDPIGYKGSEWNLYEYVNANPLVKVDPTGKWSWNPLTWFLCAKKAKDLYDCATMQDNWNDFGSECDEDYKDDTFGMIIEGQRRCPDQIYPIVGTGTLAHARICCIFKKAAQAGLDLQKFGNSASACITGFTLPFNVAGILLPRP